MALPPSLLSARVVPGAPGVLFRRVPAEVTLTGARLDACAFVGVAPRGPSWEPAFEPGRVPLDGREWRAAPRRRSVAVTVTGWAEYVRHFGGVEGPGALGTAVAAYFEQGGERAHVVRIVPRARPADGVASGGFDASVVHSSVSSAPIMLHARNQGVWGDQLVARLERRLVPVGFDHERSAPDRLVVADPAVIPTGTLLRAVVEGGAEVLTRVADVEDLWLPEGELVAGQPARRARRARVLITPALPAPAVRVDRVRLDLVVTERPAEGPALAAGSGHGAVAAAPVVDRTERHSDVGLHPAHPRYLGDVLALESFLVEPGSWVGEPLELVLPLSSLLDPTLTVSTDPFSGGLERSAEITHDDVIDPAADPAVDGDHPGVHAVLDVADVGMLAVPDLYAPGSPPPDPVAAETSAAGSTFDVCVPIHVPGFAPAGDPLAGLRLDPRRPDHRRRIAALQGALADLAEDHRTFVVLLDVPPGLDHRAVLAWRAGFGSAFAAAYHPWLLVGGDGVLAPVGPSAIAAGIVARRERERGVPVGPANELARRTVGVTAPVGGPEHDELHQSGVNVFLAERDGVRLTGARTLSVDTTFRQLSVRRLVTMLRLTLEREMQWATFEPNSPALQASVRHLVEVYLRRLWRLGAFRGAREEDAFYVRCDRTTTTAAAMDAGQLVVEIGIAPAEPVELVVVELRCGDTAVAVELRAPMEAGRG